MTKTRKAYLATNKERRNAQSRQWYQDNKERARLKIQTWRAAHPEEIKEYNRKGAKKHWASNPSKIQARQAAYYHKLKDPTFQKPCITCGNTKSEAHHWKGYEEPYWLDVQWLCREHHLAAHL